MAGWGLEADVEAWRLVESGTTHRTLNQDTERTNTHSNRKEPKPKTLKQKRIKVRHPQIRQSTSPGTRQAQKDRAHLGLILRHFGFKPPQQIAAPDKLPAKARRSLGRAHPGGATRGPDGTTGPRRPRTRPPMPKPCWFWSLMRCTASRGMPTKSRRLRRCRPMAVQIFMLSSLRSVSIKNPRASISERAPMVRQRFAARTSAAARTRWWTSGEHSP